MNKQKLTKWMNWIGDANTSGSIERELIDLAVMRKVFCGMQDMVDSNPKLQQPSAFYSVFSQGYRDSVMMFIRRQTERNPNGSGLRVLVGDLKDNCTSITREFFTDHYTKGWVDDFDRKEREKMGIEAWCKYFGNGTSPHLELEKCQDDIDQLDNIYQSLSSWVDKRLAHLDSNPPSGPVPSYDESEKACDVINDMFIKYYLLLTGSTLMIQPIQNHPWEEIFRTQWLPGQP